MLNIYRLEQRIQARVAAKQMVGLALAIVQDSEITYARGFGLTSVEDGGLAITPAARRGGTTDHSFSMS